MKLRKGDNVKILSGKDKGKTGKITKVLPKNGKIVVEGANVLVKHSKSRRQGQKGQIITIAMPFHFSKAAVICPACGKPVRIEARISGAAKVRACKKCKAEIKY